MGQLWRWGKIGTAAISAYMIFKQKNLYTSIVRFITDTPATFFQFFNNIYGFYGQSSVFAPPNFRFSKMIFLRKKIHRSVLMLSMNISRNDECSKMNRKGVPELPHLIEVMVARFAPPEQNCPTTDLNQYTYSLNSLSCMK